MIKFKWASDGYGFGYCPACGAFVYPKYHSENYDCTGPNQEHNHFRCTCGYTFVAELRHVTTEETKKHWWEK